MLVFKVSIQSSRFCYSIFICTLSPFPPFPLVLLCWSPSPYTATPFCFHITWITLTSLSLSLIVPFLVSRPKHKHTCLNTHIGKFHMREKCMCHMSESELFHLTWWFPVLFMQMSWFRFSLLLTFYLRCVPQFLYHLFLTDI